MPRALISVSDKRGIVPFAQGLVDLGWDVISTGGTYATLRQAGVPVTSVETVTGYPEGCHREHRCRRTRDAALGGEES